MHGDFSRRTFDAVDHYRGVLLQQGRVLLDADVNEQVEITAHHDEVRMRDLLGGSGGPAPDPGESGPFAIVGTGSTRDNGWEVTGAAWADLRVTPGTYYADGVLAESEPATGIGWPLADQPYLPAIGTTDPGLAEPPDDGRYAAILEVWERQVSFDEDPELLEPALGGPDTTTRAQTVWQVRLERIGDLTTPPVEQVRCSDVHARLKNPPSPLLLTAELALPARPASPCELGAAGGYRRLENQLYRVQVHQAPVRGTLTGGTVLVSRDNGSVVAGIAGLTVVDATAGTAVLTLDRVGRDEDLAFREGQLVEVTSTTRELRGLPGLLADAQAPTGEKLPITFRDAPADVPASLEALGEVPIVRRWDAGPLPMATTATDVDDSGIQVRFTAAVDAVARTGDHWLIPARTVRAVYGLTQLSGTILWPSGPDAAQPPRGPVRHRTPLAILRRDGGVWSRESDCRLLFPPLTDLVAIDDVGGDGQEALPGDELPAPLRIVVRVGDRPVPGAPVRFTASDGGLVREDGVPPSGTDTDEVIVRTGNDGSALVRWRLAPGDAANPGPDTQFLEVQRLDDHGSGVGALVTFSGRLSVARQVAWTAPAECERFARARTVQDALDTVIDRNVLRLFGGDGQSVRSAGDVVPQPVRVLVEDVCGPVAGAKVGARAGDDLTGPGRVLPRDRTTPDRPADLAAAGASEEATTVTDENGIAEFWWQPAFGNQASATLTVATQDYGRSPIRVTASLDPGGTRTPGVHITRLRFGDRRPFLNDDDVFVDDLLASIAVDLDDEIQFRAVNDKPVVRVELDLPWPGIADRDEWLTNAPFGTQTVVLSGQLRADNRVIIWFPDGPAQDWLRTRLEKALIAHELPAVTGRFVLEGWAIPAADGRRHVNTHADTRFLDGRTDLALPTDDEVTGGTFVQWFRLRRDGQVPTVTVPVVVNRQVADAQALLESEGFVVTLTRELAFGVPPGTVLRADPPEGTPVPRGSAVTLVVAGRVLFPPNPIG